MGGVRSGGRGLTAAIAQIGIGVLLPLVVVLVASERVVRGLLPAVNTIAVG